VRTVDLDEWEVVRVEHFPAPVRAVSPSSVGLADGRLVADGEAFQAHAGIVTGVVELGGGRVATASEDCTVAVWDLRTRQRLGEGRCDDFCRSVARDGQGLVTASYDGSVRRWAVDLEGA